MNLSYIRSKNTIKSDEDESIYTQEAIERRNKIDFFNRLKFEGCKKETILEILGVSISTIKRWKKAYKEGGLGGLENESRAPLKVRSSTWTHETEELILALRKKYVLFGKNKIAVMAKKEYGVTLSASMVGRVLSMLLSRGKIKPVAFFLLQGGNET